MKRSTIGPVATSLVRQIAILAQIGAADREKTIMIVEDAQSAEWASLTFVGARHVLDLQIDGDAVAVDAALAAIAHGIGELELAIPGHFVAEIRAEPRHLPNNPGSAARSLRIEALVLRD